MQPDAMRRDLFDSPRLRDDRGGEPRQLRAGNVTLTRETCHVGGGQVLGHGSNGYRFRHRPQFMIGEPAGATWISDGRLRRTAATWTHKSVPCLGRAGLRTVGFGPGMADRFVRPGRHSFWRGRLRSVQSDREFASFVGTIDR
jgi:hypothetical protein